MNVTPAEKPHYKHNCPLCVFLGVLHHSGQAAPADAYYCPGGEIECAKTRKYVANEKEPHLSKWVKISKKDAERRTFAVMAAPLVRYADFNGFTNCSFGFTASRHLPELAAALECAKTKELAPRPLVDPSVEYPDEVFQDHPRIVINQGRRGGLPTIAGSRICPLETFEELFWGETEPLEYATEYGISVEDQDAAAGWVKWGLAKGFLELDIDVGMRSARFKVQRSRVYQFLEPTDHGLPYGWEPLKK